MSYRYADAWHPPMPVLEVQLSHPEQTLSQKLHTAIVDTGADGTLVPIQLIERLNSLTDQVRVRGQWGEWHRMCMFTVDVGIGSLRLPAVEVVGDQRGDKIILGRNVPNQLRLLLDGPEALLEVLSE